MTRTFLTCARCNARIGEREETGVVRSTRIRRVVYGRGIEGIICDSCGHDNPVESTAPDAWAHAVAVEVVRILRAGQSVA